MVGIAFVVFGFVGAMFLSRVLAQLLAAMRWNDPQLFGIEELTVSAVLGFAIAAGAAIACFMNPRIYAGSLDVATELKKVTWPSLAETRVSTIAVIIASFVSALILFFFDLISSKVMTEWVPGMLGWLAKL